MKLANNIYRHKISDEVKFRPDQASAQTKFEFG